MMEENTINQDLMINLSCLIFALLRKWSIILLVVLACGMGLDTYRTMTNVPYYGVTVSAALAAEEANTFKEIEKMQSYIPTLTYLFNSRSAKNYLKERMNLQSTTVHTSIINTEANIIHITVSARTRKEAYYGMNNLLRWYSSSSHAYAFPYSITIIEKGYISLEPVNTVNHKRNLMKGGFIGAIMIIGLLSMVYFFRETLKSPGDVKRHVQRRLYVSIPYEHKKRGLRFWKKNKNPILISSLRTSFRYKEAINKLRNRVEQSAKEHHYKTIMVTSALENEGKSSVSVNLALALAKNEHKTLLIDADIRKPSVNKMLGFDHNVDYPSINHYLNGESSWESQVVNLPQSELSVLICHQDLQNARKYLSSEEFKTLLDEAKQAYDFVIVDVSPAYSLDEPSIVNAHVDTTLFVVRQDTAFRDVINDTLSRLSSVKENILGVVFNESVPDLSRGHSGYYNRYGYNRYAKRGEN